VVLATARHHLSAPAPHAVRCAPRGKVARPPQPRTPGDFFTREAHALLTQLLIARAERWQADSLPPMHFYGRESEPVWGNVAQQRCAGTTLRIAGKRVLCESLCMDLERGLRLLTLHWTPENTTAEGHTPGEWQAALAGVLWRVGQHYRELARRKGHEQARELIRLAMETLWW
jgi:hypothetical protein